MTPWHQLCFGVQALRRQVERDAADLYGALGVAALRLHHQVGNVTRILTAPRVRHLLADEVGLGKTVQALMVLNALRLRGMRRALILTPNELVSQWRDELLTRGHVAPGQDEQSEAEAAFWERRGVRLLWPGAQARLDAVDPGQYELLIVDELTQLPQGWQQRVSAQAGRFAHLLLLTATPPAHDPPRLVALLRALEPARLVAVEEEGAPPERTLAALCEEESRAAARLEGAQRAWIAQAWCALRAVVRAQRVDWPEQFPPREVHHLLVEPTEAEVERAELMGRYLPLVRQLSQDIDAEPLAQRALRSPESLQQRVTWLKGHGHDREGLLARIQPLLNRAHGDSRLDALVDLLARLWREEPGHKVLLIAGDNLTVDSLTERLPRLLGEVGPQGQRRPLVVARLRNQSAAMSDITNTQNDTASALEQFTTGNAQLMVAAEVGKVGMNLQGARHVVLYSVPWDPQDVEQYLGRVDRLGGPAHGSAGRPPVAVYTIAWRGLVDERILEVLLRADVLRRSVGLDGAVVQRVRDAVREVGLGGDPAAWQEALKGAAALAAGELPSGGFSPLTRDLPWTAATSARAWEEAQGAAPVEPVLAELKGPRGTWGEQALEGWLGAMREAGVYTLGRGSHGVQILGDPDGPGRTQQAHQVRQLSDSGSPRVNLLLRRARLECPPARRVTDDRGRTHRLHFLDHGDPVHEALVREWARLLDPSAPLIGSLKLAPGGALELMRGAWVALMVRSIRAEDALPDLGGGRPLTERAALDADRRWLGWWLRAQLLVVGARVTPGGLAGPLPAEQALALLKLPHREAETFARGTPPAGVDVAGVKAALEAQADALAWARWSPRLPAMQQALEERAFVLGEELLQARQARARCLPQSPRAAELEAEAQLLTARLGWLGHLRGLGQGQVHATSGAWALVQLR